VTTTFDTTIQVTRRELTKATSKTVGKTLNTKAERTKFIPLKGNKQS
jgi:hypothetical protein